MKLKLLIILLFCKINIYSAQSKSRPMIGSMQIDHKLISETEHLRDIKKLLAQCLPVQNTIVCRANKQVKEVKPSIAQDVLADLVFDYAQSDFKISQEVDLESIPYADGILMGQRNLMFSETLLLSIKKVNNKWQIVHKFFIDYSPFFIINKRYINIIPYAFRVLSMYSDNSLYIDHICRHEEQVRNVFSSSCDPNILLSITENNLLKLWIKGKYKMWDYINIKRFNKKIAFADMIDENTIVTINDEYEFSILKKNNNEWVVTNTVGIQKSDDIQTTKFGAISIFDEVSSLKQDLIILDSNGSVLVVQYDEENLKVIQQIISPKKFTCIEKTKDVLFLRTTNSWDIYKKVNDIWQYDNCVHGYVNENDQECEIHEILLLSDGRIIVGCKSDECAYLTVFGKLLGDFIKLQDIVIPHTGSFSLNELNDGSVLVGFSDKAFILSQCDDLIDFKSPIDESKIAQENQKKMEENGQPQIAPMAVDKATQFPSLEELEEAARLNKKRKRCKPNNPGDCIIM